MSTRTFSWHTLYLRWAGLVSACLGFISFIVLVLAYQEIAPMTKLYLGIVGFVGAFISYTIAKDFVDRIRNHENGTDVMPIHQTQLAYVGIRIGFALSNIILFFAVVSVVVFLLPPLLYRIPYFCNHLPRLEGAVEGCIREFFGN